MGARSSGGSDLVDQSFPVGAHDRILVVGESSDALGPGLRVLTVEEVNLVDSTSIEPFQA